MSGYTFKKWDRQSHPIIHLEEDWNSLIDYILGTGDSVGNITKPIIGIPSFTLSVGCEGEGTYDFRTWIKITINRMAEAGGYIIQYKPDWDDTYITFQIAQPVDGEITVRTPDLEEDTVYYVRICASGKLGGMGEWSEPQSIRTGANTIAYPIPSEVEAHGVIDGVAVSWHDDSLDGFKFINYIIYHNTIADFASATALARTTNTWYSWSISDKSKDYSPQYFWITSVSPSNIESEPSDVVVAVPLRGIEEHPIEAPENIVITKESNGDPVFFKTWMKITFDRKDEARTQNGVCSIVGYILRYRKVGDIDYTYIRVQQPITGNISIVTPYLEEDTEYEFSICMVNGSYIEGVYSDTITESTLANSGIPPPLTNVAAYSILNGVLIEWDSLGILPNAFYRIYKNTVDDPETAIVVGEVTTAGFRWSVKDNNTDYVIQYFWVVVVNSGGIEGERLNSVSAIPRKGIESPAIEVPSNIIITTESNNDSVFFKTWVRVSFDRKDEAATQNGTCTVNGYMLRYKKIGDTDYSYIRIQQPVTGNISAITPYLEEDTEYEFSVCIINGSNIEGVYSEKVHQSTLSNSGIPPTLTNLVAYPIINGVLLEWDSLGILPNAFYRIYKNTIDDPETSTIVGEATTSGFVWNVKDNNTDFVPQYFWVVVVNSGGVESEKGDSAEATPLKDIEKFATETPSNIVVTPQSNNDPIFFKTWVKITFDRKDEANTQDGKCSVSGYTIRYKKISDIDYSYIRVQQPSTGNVSAITPYLEENTEYMFSVSIINGSNIDGVYSEPTIISTLPNNIQPEPLTNVIATPVMDGVFIEWDSLGILSNAFYRIYKNTVDEPTTATVVGELTTAGFRWSVKDNNTDYVTQYFWVVVVNSGGVESEKGDSVSAIPQKGIEKPAIEVPNNITVTPESNNDSILFKTWMRISFDRKLAARTSDGGCSVSGYIVRYKKTSDSIYSQIYIPQPASDNISIVTPHLEEGVEYTFKVCIVNGSGIEGIDSNNIVKTALTNNLTPPPVSNLKAYPILNGVLLEWDSIGLLNNVLYRVYNNSVDEFETAIVVGEVSTSGFTWNVKDSNTDYIPQYFWVTIVNSGGIESEEGNSIQETPLKGIEQRPNESTTFTLTVKSNNNSLFFKTWVEIEINRKDTASTLDGTCSIGGYVVQYKKSSETIYSHINVPQPANDNPKIITPYLEEDTSYDFRVCLINSSGLEGVWSQVVTKTTAANNGVPPEVTNLKSTPILNGVLLEWDSFGILENAFYRVYNSHTNVFNDAIVVGETKTAGYTWSVKDQNNDYVNQYFWVVLVNSSGIEGSHDLYVSATPAKLIIPDIGIEMKPWSSNIVIWEDEYLKGKFYWSNAKNGTGNATIAFSDGTTQTITANTNGITFTSGLHYLYVESGSTELKDTTVFTQAVGIGKHLIATLNVSINAPSTINPYNSYTPTIGAGAIAAKSVTASNLVTDTAVITDALQIGQGLISTNHLDTIVLSSPKIKIAGSTQFSEYLDGDGATTTIKGSKITSGSISADKLMTGQLTIGYLDEDTQEKIINGDAAKTLTDLWRDGETTLIHGGNIKTGTIEAKCLTLLPIDTNPESPTYGKIIPKTDGESAFTTTIDGNQISANTINVQHLNIGFVDTDIESPTYGKIITRRGEGENEESMFATTITGGQIDTHTITSDNILEIKAEKLYVDAETTFDSFLEDDNGVTTINGGHIKSRSIEADRLATNVLSVGNFNQDALDRMFESKADKDKFDVTKAWIDSRGDATFIDGGKIYTGSIEALSLNIPYINTNPQDDNYGKIIPVVNGKSAFATTISGDQITTGTLSAKAIVASTINTQNLISNSSFEDEYEITGSETRSTEQQYHGRYSAKLVASGTNAYSTPLNKIDVRGIDALTVGVKVKITSLTIGNFYIRIRYYDTEETLLSAAELKSYNAVTTGWDYYSTTLNTNTFPANTAFVAFDFIWWNSSNNPSGTAYVDAWQCHTGEYLPAYDEGMITAPFIKTNSITSDHVLEISAEKLYIDAETQFSSFLEDDNGVTRIDGGHIKTNSISANRLMAGGLTIGNFSQEVIDKIAKGEDAKDLTDLWRNGDATYIDGGYIKTGTIEALSLNIPYIDSNPSSPTYGKIIPKVGNESAFATTIDGDRITTGTLSAKAIIASSLSTANLIANSSFEDGKWKNEGEGSEVISTEQSYHGQYSAKLTASGANRYSGASNRIDVRNISKFTVAVKTKITSLTIGDFIIRIRYYDAEETLLSSQNLKSYNAVTSGWDEFKTTLTTSSFPTNTAFIAFDFLWFNETGNPSGIAYVDAWQCHSGEYLPAYDEGMISSPFIKTNAITSDHVLGLTAEKLIVDTALGVTFGSWLEKDDGNVTTINGSHIKTNSIQANKLATNVLSVGNFNQDALDRMFNSAEDKEKFDVTKAWIDSRGDATFIDGGKIYTGSIVANKLSIPYIDSNPSSPTYGKIIPVVNGKSAFATTISGDQITTGTLNARAIIASSINTNNLIANSSFEDGAWIGTNAVVTTEEAYHGSYSAKSVANNGSTAWSLCPNFIDIRGLNRLTVAARVKVTSITTPSFLLATFFYDENKQTISPTSHLDWKTYTTTTLGWDLATATLDVNNFPAGTVYIRIGYCWWNSSNNPTGTAYVDAVQLVAGEYLPSYDEGMISSPFIKTNAITSDHILELMAEKINIAGETTFDTFFSKDTDNVTRIDGGHITSKSITADKLVAGSLAIGNFSQEVIDKIAKGEDAKDLTDLWRNGDTTYINGGYIKTGTIEANRLNIPYIDSNPSSPTYGKIIPVVNGKSAFATTISGDQITTGTLNARAIIASSLSTNNLIANSSFEDGKWENEREGSEVISTEQSYHGQYSAKLVATGTNVSSGVSNKIDIRGLTHVAVAVRVIITAFTTGNFYIGMRYYNAQGVHLSHSDMKVYSAATFVWDEFSAVYNVSGFPANTAFIAFDFAWWNPLNNPSGTAYIDAWQCHSGEYLPAYDEGMITAPFIRTNSITSSNILDLNAEKIFLNAGGERVSITKVDTKDGDKVKIDGAQIVTDSITGAALNAESCAGKVRSKLNLTADDIIIDGATQFKLSQWRDAYDVTKINGGVISAKSITLKSIHGTVDDPEKDYETTIDGKYIKTHSITASEITTSDLIGLTIKTNVSGPRVEITSNGIIGYKNDNDAEFEILRKDGKAWFGDRTASIGRDGITFTDDRAIIQFYEDDTLRGVIATDDDANAFYIDCNSGDFRISTGASGGDNGGSIHLVPSNRKIECTGDLFPIDNGEWSIGSEKIRWNNGYFINLTADRFGRNDPIQMVMLGKIQYGQSGVPDDNMVIFPYLSGKGMLGVKGVDDAHTILWGEVNTTKLFVDYNGGVTGHLRPAVVSNPQVDGYSLGGSDHNRYWKDLHVYKIFVEELERRTNPKTDWLVSRSPIKISTEGIEQSEVIFTFRWALETGNCDIKTRVVHCATTYQVSDKRDKDLVANIQMEQALDKINKLNPILYKFKNNDDKQIYGGFFAQDVEEVIPEAVVTAKIDEVDDKKSLNYNTVYTYAVAAIQELSKQIEKLKAEVEELKKKIK